jgi:cytochrome P450
VDIFNLMNRFTLDTIGEVGFGKTIGSLEDPSSPFLKSFDVAQQITFTRFYDPLWALHRFLGTGFERGTREHFGRLDDYSRNVVKELQGALNQNGKNGVAWADIEARKSFVGLFLEDAKKRGEVLEEDYLRDLVLNFLIAGRDTTAQALSWTFYCLATNPEAEAKAREEVLDVCDGQLPCYEDMNRLPYVQAVLSEALRLFPSVPNDIKLSESDDTWPDGTFIPAGSMVVYNIYAMGRDKTIWGDDAETFRPERWTEMTESPDIYDYPVFNAGPRECLGKRLAQVEMKACLASILPRVSFKLAVPADQIRPDAQLTIGMSSGLPMFVTALAPQDDLASNVSTAAHSTCADSLDEDEA